MKPTILLIPEKTDAEFEQVFATWTSKGGQIQRPGKYWIRDEALATQDIAIYGNQTFALVLAQIYDVTLLSPDDTLIARLEHPWIKRHIAVHACWGAGLNNCNAENVIDCIISATKN